MNQAGTVKIERNKEEGLKRNVSKKEATGTNTAAGSRLMKRNLNTGVKVCDNRVKKNQRHTTNKKPNMYEDVYNDN